MGSDYDVIVVGAGPAGSTCATYLAGAGLSTLLIEKEIMPRPKACGGGVTAKAERLLGFPIPDELVERRAYGVRINYWGAVNSCRKTRPITALVCRDKFDKYLADRAVSAGACLMEGNRAGGVSRDGPLQSVDSDEGRFTSKVVVGADGVTSAIAERVRGKLSKYELAIGLEAEVPMDASEIGKRYGEYLDIYFGNTPWEGCGWIFPKRDCVNAGLASLLRISNNPRRRFTRFLQKRGLPTDAKVQAHMIPLGSPGRKVVADGIILVGDAAGYADPLTGEGIYAAVYSGKLAAETIIEARRRGDYSAEALRPYHDRCRQAFSEEFRRAWKASLSVFGFPPLSYPLILGNKEILCKYVDVISGELTYKAFKQWAKPKTPEFLRRGIMGG